MFEASTARGESGGVEGTASVTCRVAKIQQREPKNGTKVDSDTGCVNCSSSAGTVAFVWNVAFSAIQTAVAADQRYFAAHTLRRESAKGQDSHRRFARHSGSEFFRD